MSKSVALRSAVEPVACTSRETWTRANSQPFVGDQSQAGHEGLVARGIAHEHRVDPAPARRIVRLDIRRADRVGGRADFAGGHVFAIESGGRLQVEAVGLRSPFENDVVIASGGIDGNLFCVKHGATGGSLHDFALKGPQVELAVHARPRDRRRVAAFAAVEPHHDRAGELDLKTRQQEPERWTSISAVSSLLRPKPRRNTAVAPVEVVVTRAAPGNDNS